MCVTNANACRARRSGRHARVPFTAAQAAALEAAYARAPYLAPPALRALAAALQLRDDRIKIWFQNRRARARREKCATISPPQAVTLPPTAMPQTHASHTSWAQPPNVSIVNRQITYDVTESPQDLSSSSNELCNWSSSYDDTPIQVRPESPLDVETIEEN